MRWREFTTGFSKKPPEEQGILDSITDTAKDAYEWARDNTAAQTRLLLGMGTEAFGKALNFLGDEDTLAAKYNPSVASTLRSAGDSANNLARGLLTSAADIAPVADYDSPVGAFANQVTGAVHGGIGRMASMLHLDQTADAGYNAAQRTANTTPVSTDDLVEYFTNPRGFISDTGQLVGSMATIVPFMELLPGATAARGLAALGGDTLVQGLVNRGMYGLAKFFASSMPRAVQYGLTSAPIEGAMEGGETRRELLNRGASEEEATRESLIAMGKNVPLLVASNTLEGLSFFSPLRAGNKALQIGGRGLVNSLQQQYEEFVQQGIQNEALGEPSGWLPWNGAPNQYEAAERVRYPSLLMGGAGGAIQAYAGDDRQDNWERGSQEKNSIGDYSTRANKSANSLALDNFMQAIGQQESDGNYDLTNPDSGAAGKFQIMPDNWSSWAQDAGLSPDAPMTPENQNLVARNKMQEYFNKFGNWRDVAIAWYGGEGAVDWSEEAKNRPQGEYPSVNEYADSVMARFVSLDNKKSKGQANGIDFATGLQSAKKALDGKQMDNGTVGCVEAVTKILSHVHPEFKKMVEDGVVNTVEGDNSLHSRLEKMGIEIIPFDESKVAQGDIIFYDDKQTYQHVLVADHKDENGQWRVFGNSSSNNRVMEQPLYQGQTPSWIAKVSNLQSSQHSQGQTQQGQPQQKETPEPEPTKPLFDLNAEDSTTQNLLEKFLNERADKAIADNNVQEAEFISGLFDDNSVFQNTQANREALAQRYGDAINTFFQNNLQEQAQTDSPQKESKTETKGKSKQEKPYDRNAAVISKGREFLDELMKNADATSKENAWKLNSAIQSNDVAAVENILKQNNVAIPEPKSTQTQSSQDPVKENASPENVLSQSNKNTKGQEKLIKRASQLVTPKTSHDKKQKIGNAIIQLANQNGISVPAVDFKSLQNGSSKKIKEWQGKLSETGAFTVQPQQSQTSENAPAEPSLKERLNQFLTNAKTAAENQDLNNRVSQTTSAQSQTQEQTQETALPQSQIQTQQQTQPQETAPAQTQPQDNEQATQQPTIQDATPESVSEQTQSQIQESATQEQSATESPAQEQPQETQLQQTQEQEQPQEQPQPQEQEKTKPKTLEERLVSKANSPISKHRTARIEHGKAIARLAKKAGVDIPKPVETSLENGNEKAIEEARRIINEQTNIQTPQQQETPETKQVEVTNVEPVAPTQEIEAPKQTQEQPQETTSQQIQEQETPQSQEQETESTQPQVQEKQQEVAQPQSDGRYGNTAEVITGSRKPHQIQYRVVEADELNSSHIIDNGRVFANESYPTEFQPRDRTRANMQAHLISMGNNLSPNDLLDARDVNQGAPVIRNDGVVLNGNGRTAAIRYAYENSKGESYKKALIDNAQRLGLSADEISKMNRPVLVRELANDLTEDDIRDITGTQTGGARMGASEQAQADAKRISNETLGIFPQSDNVDLTKAESADFLRAALNDIATPDELNSLTTNNGQVNQDGINRVKRAIFALAYGDGGLISRMSESTDDNVRGATNALLTAAPSIATVQSGMKNGTLHNYDLSAIANAVKRLAALRDEGKTVSNYLQEQSLFADQADSDETREILTTLDRNKRAPNKIATFLKKIASNIQAQGDPRQGSLFGESEPAPLIDLIRRARQDVEGGGQASLFAQEQKQSEQQPSAQPQQNSTETQDTSSATETPKTETQPAQETAPETEQQNSKAESETQTPETQTQETSKHETPAQDTSKPESSQSETSKPQETSNLETSQSETSKPQEESSTESPSQEKSETKQQEPAEERKQSQKNKAKAELEAKVTQISDEETRKKGQNVLNALNRGVITLREATNMIEELINPTPKRVADAKNFDELAKLFKKKYNTEIELPDQQKPYNKIDFEAFKEFLSGVEQVLDEFPMFADRVHRIIVALTKKKERYAEYHGAPLRRMHGIQANLKAFLESEIEQTKLKMAQDKEDGWSPVGSFKGLGTHEATHFIGYMIFHKVGIIYSFKEFPHKTLVDLAYASIKKSIKKSLAKSRAEISEYATKKSRETIAEAGADFFAHGEQAKPLAKAILNLLKLLARNPAMADERLITSQKNLDGFKGVAKNGFRGALTSGAALKWFSAHRSEGYSQTQVEEALFDIGLADILSNIRKNGGSLQEWENALREHVPDEKIMESSDEWTDARINEAIKVTYAKNALEQVGAKINNGKVSFPDAATKNAAIEALKNWETPDFKLSSTGNSRLDVTDVVAPEELTPQQKLLQSFGEKLGVKTIFVRDTDSTAHGAYAGNISYINVNSEMPIGKVFWHESMHWLKASNPKLYQQLVKAAGITDEQRQAYLEQTERDNLYTDAEIDEEIIADQFEDIAKRNGLLQSIAGKNRGLVERVVQWLKDTMNKFIEFFHNPQGKLTTKQKQTLSDEFGKIATRLVDPNGERIFHYNRRTHNLETIGGRSMAKTTPLNEVSEIKYSLGRSDSSSESLTQKIRNAFSSWWKGGAKKNRNREITDLLYRVTGYKVDFGNVKDADKTIIDDVHKVIRAKHAYEWDKLLPQIGGKIAKSLKLNPTEEMSNYIADWCMTGAVGNQSAEAKAFEKAMRNDPVTAGLMLQIRESFQEFNDMTAEQKIGSTIVSRLQGKSPREIARTLWSDKEEEITDDLHPVLRQINDMIAKAEKTSPTLAKMMKEDINPYQMMRLLRGVGGLGNLMIGTEKVKDIEDVRDQFRAIYPRLKFDRLVPLDMIVDMAGGKKHVDKFMDYAVAKLDKEMHEKLREDPTADIRPQFSEAVDDEVIKNGEAQYAEAHRALVTYSNILLCIRHDAGLISDNQFTKEIKGWKNYIPMARVFEDGEESYTVEDSLKHKTGSQRSSYNALETLTQNTYDILSRAERNKAKQQLAFYARIGEFGDIIQEVETSNPGKNVISFREGGKIKYLKVFDPAVKRAVDNIYSPADTSWIMKFLRATMSIVRNMRTMASPDFSIGNLFRDMQDAYIHNRHADANPLKALLDVFHEGFKGFGFKRMLKEKSLVPHDTDWAEFNALGGTQSTFVSEDVDQLRRSMNKLTRKTFKESFKEAPLHTVLDRLQWLSEQTEYMTRLNSYKRAKAELAKQHGGNATLADKRLAALEARDASIDFAKAGTSTRKVNQLLMFANAQVQDWAKWGVIGRDYFKGGEARKIATQKIGRLVLNGVVTTLLFAALNRSDDDRKEKYKKRPDWEKETYWIFGDGVRIPKGQDIATRFVSALTDEFIGKALDDDPVSTKRLLKVIRDAVPSIIPSLIEPAYEVRMNYSAFRDAPIVPVGQQRLDKAEQYGRYTSSFAKLFSEMTGLTSPRGVDYLISSYLGSTGRFATQLPDYMFGRGITLNDVLMVRRFVFDPAENTKTVKEYYEAYDEQYKHYNTYKLRRKWDKNAKPHEDYDPKLFARLKAAQKPLQNISAAENNILRNPKLDWDTKNKKIRELEKKREKICEKVMQRAR